MPPELIRKAVEDAIRDGLEAQEGDWSAFLPDGKEIEFSPQENGLIVVTVSEGDGADYLEYEVKLQVCVKLVD